MILLISFGFNKALDMQMKNRYRYAVVALLLVSPLAACGNSAPIFKCDREIVASVESQDSKFKAAVLLVQCGATTADATWVLLAPVTREFDPEVDKVAIFEGRQVELTWRNGALNVAYENARIFRSDATAHGVKINYISKLKEGGVN